MRQRIVGSVGVLSGVAAVEVMPTSYSFGVFFAYCAIIAFAVEILFDPWLLQRRWQIQVALFAILLVGFDWLTITVVAERAPISFYAYAMRNGNHPSGSNVEGIVWDSHFTDTRVAVTNPNNKDYRDLDIAIHPDRPVYRAVMIAGPPSCALLSMGGNKLGGSRLTKSGPLTVRSVPAGDTVDVQDSEGNLTETLGTDGGYRLKCSTFPSKFTVRIVFALIEVDPRWMPDTSHPIGSPGTWNLSVEVLRGVTSPFEILVQQPSTSAVSLDGSYKTLRTFSVSGTIPVEDGN